MRRLSARVVVLCLLLFVASSIYSTLNPRGSRSNSRDGRTRAHQGPYKFPRLPSVNDLPPFISQTVHDASGKDKPKYKFAFATFLTEDGKDNILEDLGERFARKSKSSYANGVVDGYFTATRVLAFSLLHYDLTRVRRPIPFLVLHTRKVSSQKLERLKADGATLVPAHDITGDDRKVFNSKSNVIDLDTSLTPDWIHDLLGSEPWHDVLAKLKLFTLTQYEKICFIDADTLINERIDAIFEDPATGMRQTTSTYNRTSVRIERTHAVTIQDADQDTDPDAGAFEDDPQYADAVPIREDEVPLPKEYMIAGRADVPGYDDPIPSIPFDSLPSSMALTKLEAVATSLSVPSQSPTATQMQMISNKKSDQKEAYSKSRTRAKLDKDRRVMTPDNRPNFRPQTSAVLEQKSPFIGKFKPLVSAPTELISSLDTKPIPEDNANLNSGFFVFHPCMRMYEYYISILTNPGRFDPQFPDRNLLNYAHRRGRGIPYNYKPPTNDEMSLSTDSVVDRSNADQDVGAMPWAQLDWKWNALWPTARDLGAGIRSFHGKFWEDPVKDEGVFSSKDDAILREMWWKRVKEMEAFYGST